MSFFTRRLKLYGRWISDFIWLSEPISDMTWGILKSIAIILWKIVLFVITLIVMALGVVTEFFFILFGIDTGGFSRARAHIRLKKELNREVDRMFKEFEKQENSEVRNEESKENSNS